MTIFPDLDNCEEWSDTLSEIREEEEETEEEDEEDDDDKWEDRELDVEFDEPLLTEMREDEVKEEVELEKTEFRPSSLGIKSRLYIED